MALTELQPFNLNDTANYTFGNATVTGNMNVGNAVIYTSANTLIIQNPEGGTFSVSGTGSAGTSQIANGDSNISILNNANINFSVAGYSNRVVFSETTANFAANLTVNGLITGGNANLGNSVTANFFVGNLNGNASFANVANIANYVLGNAVNGAVALSEVVTSSSQPNITSVGTLTDLSVAGNVTATTLGGALTSSSHPNVTQLGTLTSLTVTGNVVTANHFVSNNITGNGTSITISADGTNQNINLRPTGTGIVDAGNFRISNVATPTQATDVATKEYVDSTAQGLNVHPSANAATTTTLAVASSGTTSYNNGTSGVGATITTTGTFTTIDGVNIASVGTRILVKNEANAVWNGIYTYTNSTTLTRATDFDTTAEVAGGDFLFITSGTVNGDTGWVETTDGPTIGVDNIQFTQFSGTGTYSAGYGLTLTGTQFSVNNALPNLTSVGTLANLSVTGNVSGGNVSTTGTANIGALVVTGTSNLNAISNIIVTGGSNGQVIQTDGNGNLSFATIDTWRIQNGVSNVSVPSVNGNVVISVSGNTSIATFTGNGVNILGTLNATGLITGNGGGLSNIAGPNVIGAVANATYAATAGGATTATNITGNSQPNITSLGTLSNVTVSGNANVGALLTNSILYANGSPYEFTTNAGGQNTYVQFNDSNIFGGSANFTFDKTTNTLTVTKIAGNGAALTNLTGANVSGFVPNANYANSSGTAVTVTGNSQPNITTVGILSNLTISGNTTSGNFTTSGTVNMGTLAVSGNGTITGNLTVSGTTTFVNTSTLDVEYPIIGVGRGPNNAPLTTNDGKDRGEQLWYYTTSEKQAFIGYDNSTGNLIAATDVSIFNEVVTVNNWGNFVAGGITSQGSLQVTGNATITGNLTVIGNTTYTNSNNLNVSNTIISMGRGANDTPLTNNDGLDRGSQMWYYTSSEKSSFMGYDNSSGKLIAATDVSIANSIVTVNAYGTLVAGNLEVAGIVASGDLSAANVLGGNTVSANYFAGTLTTASQPNITSLGTLTGANVNGNITAANITANTGKFTGNGAGLTNLAGANVTGQVSYAATANSVAVGNVSGIGNIATINKDGNSSNILYGNGVFSSAPVTYGNSNVATFLASFGSNTISTTGNANVGNIGATTFVGNLNGSGNSNVGNLGTSGLIVATGNITGGNLTTSGALSVTGNANVGNIGANNAVFTGTGSFGGNVNMNSKNITNLADPVNAQDAATKNYVDTTATGLHVHPSCNAATTGTLATASGGSVTYNNGSSGVGATLTTTGSYTTIDGVNIATVGTRILVKSESNGAWNGVYTYTSSTVLTRATDFDTNTEAAGGDFLFVTSGTQYADSGWVQTTDNPVIGTSALVFSQFSGAGTYTAGTGLTLTGTTFSVNASQTQITAVGTLTTLGVNGNITAANITANTGVFTGNGNGLSSLQASNITGTVASATAATNAAALLQNTSSSTTVYPTFTTSSSNGNSQAVFNTSISANLSNASITATTFVGALSGTATSATSATNAAALLQNTSSSTTVYPMFTTSGSNGNSQAVFNTSVSANLGNASITATTFVGALSGAATTAGTVTTAAQPNITSVGTLTSLGVNGTITGVNITANTGVFTGNANGISSVQAGNIVGTTLSSSVVTSSLTTVGTLGSLTVSGVSVLPKININRSSGAGTGITWYSSSYSSWTDYMSSAGATGCGPYANITAPTGNLVTSWGLRSFIENSSGYGWTWESGTAQQTTPSIVAELRSSDGSFRNTGNIYCVGDVITNYSDEKLKDVVGRIENAVEKVCAIDTFYYRPNDIAKSLGVADEIQVGVGAGSVEKVASEVVKPSPLHPDYKTVMYERLVPYLIESIKEHEKTIQELKQEVKKLKGE